MKPLSMIGMIAILVWWSTAGCGPGVLYPGSGAGSSRFKLGMDGNCETPDGSACLFNVPVEPPPDVPSDTPPEDLPPEEGGCWVTGIGTFGKGNTRDSFGGNGMTMKHGYVRGEWNHVDHYDETETQPNGQNHFHGQVTYLVCKKYPTLNGPDVPKAIPNYAVWGGMGKYNNVDGHFFEVRAFDHSEPGTHRDRYVIEVYDANKQLVLHADGKGTYDTPPNTKGCLEDSTVTADLAWVLEMGCLSGGNFQIHPPNQGHPYENP